jgi:SAM-dependent methyltransferase
MNQDLFEAGAPERPSTSNFEKYQTRNPVVLYLIERFLRRVTRHVAEIRPARIVDAGCGEGLFAQKLLELSSSIDYLGFDINPDACRAAKRLNPDRTFQQADLFEIELADGEADLIVCLELLEHLAEPERAVARFSRWTTRAAVISVPWEPFFRAGSLLRGKYVYTLGNHPEHIRQFDRESFRRLVATAFEVVRVESCFPWLIAVAFK